MRTECFDFHEIVDQSHFFRQFAERFGFDERRINDLDSLWAVITTGQLPMPLAIEWINTGSGQKRRYGALILLFEEAEEELEGQLRFTVR